MDWLAKPKNLIILGVAFIIVICICVMLIPKEKMSFSPQVLGTVKDVTNEQLSEFISNTGIAEVRALAIMSPDTYSKKKQQLKRSMELYSLIDQRLFPQIYEKVFAGLHGEKAKEDDVGGIILSHHRGLELEIYAMIAPAKDQEISVANQTFSTQEQAEVAVNSFYHNLNGLSDYLVVLINGPNLTDLDEIVDTDQGETILDDSDESFGMYDSALPEWLEEHSENDRFQTPTQHIPTQTPDITRYIRNSNKASAMTQKSDPY